MTTQNKGGLKNSSKTVTLGQQAVGQKVEKFETQKNETKQKERIKKEPIKPILMQAYVWQAQPDLVGNYGSGT